MDIKEVAKKYTREEFLKSDIIMDWCPSDYRLKKDCAKHMPCFCCEGIKKSMEYSCPKCWGNAIKNVKFKGESVTFQEVLDSNKKCRVKHELIRKNENLLGMSEKKFRNFDDIMQKLSSTFWEKELKEVIKNGKWYLED